MTFFTLSNTEGHTQADCDVMNAAVTRMMSLGMAESNACDIVSGNWFDGVNTVESLIRIAPVQRPAAVPEAIKGLDRIAHFEAVQIIQDAARRAARSNNHVQVCIGAAFGAWLSTCTEDDEECGMSARVDRALANLGLPILRDTAPKSLGMTIKRAKG